MSEAVPSTSGDGGGGREPRSSVELIHGVSDLPDGYGKILDTATMLYIKLCILLICSSNAAKMLLQCWLDAADYLLCTCCTLATFI